MMKTLDATLLSEFNHALHIAQAVAQEVGHYQKSLLGGERRIEYKGEINLVTEVDKKSEEILVSRLHQHFPHHDILAEEGSGTRKDSEFKWIIDPLDGTTNYAHGYPLFCVSMGLEFQGEVVLGVVFDPNHNELFTAIHSQGSKLNNKSLRVSSTPSVLRSLLATGFAYNFKEDIGFDMALFAQLLGNTQAVRRDGVAAIDLCYVACGRYDGFWERNLFPWDVAAGSLILAEAGGRLSDFSGADFSIYGKQILASNSLIHDELLKLIKAPRS